MSRGATSDVAGQSDAGGGRCPDGAGRSDLDGGVQDGQAVRAGQYRIERPRGAPRLLVGQPADPQQQIGQRRQVHRRGAPVAVQQRRRPRLAPPARRRRGRSAAPAARPGRRAARWRPRPGRSRPPGRTPGHPPSPPRRPPRARPSAGPAPAGRTGRPAPGRPGVPRPRRPGPAGPRRGRGGGAGPGWPPSPRPDSRAGPAAVTAASAESARAEGDHLDAVRGTARSAAGPLVDCSATGHGHARRPASAQPVGVPGHPGQRPSPPPRPSRVRRAAGVRRRWPPSAVGTGIAAPGHGGGKSALGDGSAGPAAAGRRPRPRRPRGRRLATGERAPKSAPPTRGRRRGQPSARQALAAAGGLGEPADQGGGVADHPTRRPAGRGWSASSRPDVEQLGHGVHPDHPGVREQARPTAVERPGLDAGPAAGGRARPRPPRSACPGPARRAIRANLRGLPNVSRYSRTTSVARVVAPVLQQVVAGDVGPVAGRDEGGQAQPARAAPRPAARCRARRTG